MKTTVEKLKDDQVKLTVTIEKSVVDEHIKNTYKDFAKRYKFPGFRSGKAPRPVIDNVIGADAVLANVTDELTNDSYPLALDEQNLIPIDDPKFENGDGMVEEGKDYSFAVTMTLEPEFDLDSYDPVDIKLLSDQPTDEEVEERVQSLREYYYDLQDAAKTAKIADRGCAEITMSVSDDKGNAVNVLSCENRLYELGMGLYPEEIDEGLVGMKAGDKKTVEIDLTKSVGSILTRALEGEPEKLIAEIEVVKVKKKVLPEITEEWAKETAGFKGLEDLHNRTRDNMVRERQEYLPRMKENACLYKIASRLKGEAPEIMCVDERRELLTSFFNQLQQQGITYDAYLSQRDMTNEQFQEDLKQQSEDMVKQNLALAAWARHFKIEVTEKDIQEEFDNSGAENIDALKKQWHDEGRIRILRQSILRAKAVENLMDSAKVVEASAAEIAEENEAAKASSKAKKPAAKKAPAKKAPAKKAPAKKPAAKKTETETAEKPAAKKAPAKKAPAKKAPAKKTTAAAADKPAAKKAPAKKAPAKKAPAKKTEE